MIATYSRTIIAVFLVLFSSRWVLNELGTSDFGLFSLVGSILVFVSFLNTVLANGDARFFSIAIGKNDKEHMRNLFSSSLVLHLILLPVLIILGWIVGEFAIRYFLEIPVERVEAALIIFYISLVTAFFSMLAVPFRALFIAHQNIVSSTFLDLLQTLSLFLVAYLLKFYHGDKLIFYGLMYSTVQVAICVSFVVYAKYKYSYCVSLSKKMDRGIVMSLLKYSFWNALGDMGHLVRTQGTVIIVNLLYGTIGNAALGIANQVSMQAGGLSNSLINATSPEVYRRVGAGNIKSAISFSNFLNKIGVLLILLLAIPLIINIDEILSLWLIHVPAHTAELCICFIVMFILERYTTGFLIYLKAINSLSLVQSSIFICYFLSVVFPFCGFCSYFGILGIGLSCILSMLLSRICILYVYFRKIRFSVSQYLKQLVGGSFIVFLSLLCLANYVIPSSFIGIYAIMWVSCLVVLVTVLFYYSLVFSPNEKLTVIKLIKKCFV